MKLALQPGYLHPQFWWYATRATGITAWIASIGSALAGLALATRTLGKQPKGPWLLDLHRGLAGITLAFTGLHLGALVGDSYVHFGAADLLVPLASGYKPLAVAAGIVALWLLVAVEVSSLAMKRLPKRVWHMIHLASYGALAAATGHLFTAGTDAMHPGVLAVSFASVLLGAFMIVYRVVAPAKPERVIPSRHVAAAGARGQTGENLTDRSTFPTPGDPSWQLPSSSTPSVPPAASASVSSPAGTPPTSPLRSSRPSRSATASIPT